MKSLLLTALFVSTSAFAMPPLPPEAYKSTEVLSCAQGNETLSVQVLTNVYSGNDLVAVGTFVDYRVNGQPVYSTTSYNKPNFIAAGAGAYSVDGNSTEVGKVLYFGYDYMAIVARLDSFPAPGSRGVMKNLFAFNNCKETGAIRQFMNIGNPPVDMPTVPAPKKKNSSKKWDILRKI